MNYFDLILYLEKTLTCFLTRYKIKLSTNIATITSYNERNNRTF